MFFFCMFFVAVNWLVPFSLYLNMDERRLTEA